MCRQPAMQAESDKSEFPENPYISHVVKKIRALKKKLSKITALEEKIALKPNAPLNEDQVEVLSSKTRVVNSLVDLEALKTQLDEIEADEPPARRDAPAPPPPAPVQAPEPAPPPPPNVDVQAEVQAAVLRLLRLLHVVARVDGLPTPVLFYGRALLGQASLPEDDFEDALHQSVVEAQLYLDGSPRVLAEGLTYASLEGIVDARAAARAE
ncbi:hypothetical protein M885DRAFT_507264 [Pelagophyceae sp. CCMP2097]|nr:hypothetical protein M885DRAFT_507264 [Pelagophyceae sp. CCMP2097]|mmetsp:Transcript_10428/g.36153  ORF Transcript_10428/g.36153 Transcript_10428/m.36153 type:complete len:211 (-) Transcript_10428:92-724(-)